MAFQGGRSSRCQVVSLHPSRWRPCGVRRRGLFYFAVRLAFGCHGSPKIFDALSGALCWVLSDEGGLPFVLRLLDDFLLVDFPSADPGRGVTTLRSAFSR